MTAAPTEGTPLTCLYHWEKTRPDAVHFTQPIGNGQVEEYTWAQAMDQVRRMAAWLKAQNLPPKSQVAILGKNTAHWIMADWAIWMAGHVTVPLYPTLNSDTVNYILTHSESRVLFVGKLDDWDMMKPGVPDDLPVVRMPLAPETKGHSWQEIIETTEPLQGEPDRELDELATIVYTSGSTGRPKGVMQNFRAFRIAGTLLHELFPLNVEDRMLSYLPLAHVAERLVVENNSTYHGFHVFFAESLDTFIQDLHRARPTIFFSVPRLWTKFQIAVCSKLPLKKQKLLFRIPLLGGKVKHKILEQLGLEHVRIAFTGAAPLPPTTIAWYRSLGLELLEAYGMSENFAYSHFTRPGDARTGYVGPPNPGVECRIGEDGEVLVKSPAQMSGYFKDPEKTAECYTEDGYFRTGDMGEIDESGRLRITGRVKDLFKTAKGKYVAPVPIENRLGSSPKIEVVCVCGANRSSTYGLVLLSEDSRAALANGSGDRTEIEQALTEKMHEVNTGLDPHERLQFMVVVKEPWTIENGFLTPTMKIRRNIIEEHYEPLADAWHEEGKPLVWER